MQKKKKESRLYILDRNYLKWIIDLHLKHKTIKFLEDIIGENLDGLGYGNNFLEYKSIWRDGICWNSVYFQLNFAMILKLL